MVARRLALGLMQALGQASVGNVLQPAQSSQQAPMSSSLTNGPPIYEQARPLASMSATASPRLIQPCFEESCPPWTDTDGNRIEAHAAGMLQSPLDEKWYWYGESAKGSVDSDGSMLHGVNCYSSSDLAGPWQFEGRVLKQSDVHIEHGAARNVTKPFIIERPKVLFNPRTKTFVMWFHLETEGYLYRHAGVATSQTANGRFSFVHSMQPDGLPSLDMSLFRDPLDDQAYFIRSVNNEYTAISRLTDDYLSSTGIISTHRPIFEGMAIFRHTNGTLYCIASHLTNWDPNPLMALRATGTSLDDPQWVDMGNPTGNPISFNTQPTFVVSATSRTGEQFFIYLADNWVHAGPAGLPHASYVWLPLRFTKGTLRLERLNRWDLEDPFGCTGTELRRGCCDSRWTEEEALCYAQSNPDIARGFCVNNETSSSACDTDALRCHYKNRGIGEGRKIGGKSGCSPTPSPSVWLGTPSEPSPTPLPSPTPSLSLTSPTRQLGQQFDDAQWHGDQQADPQLQTAGEVAGESQRQKKQHFMIISRPHNGANWLKDMLNENPAVFCHGEPLLNKKSADVDTFKRDFLWDRTPKQVGHPRIVASLAEGFSWFHSQGEVDFIASKFLNLTKGISRETLQRGADFTRWLVDNDVKIILLERHNKLARRVNALNTSAAQEHAVIDARNLVKGLQSDEELTSETPPFLLGKGVHKDNIANFSYDELAADPASVMARVFSFIGAHNTSELHSVGLQKTRSKLRDLIQNVGEVETALSGTKWLQELELPVLDDGGD